MPLGNLGGLDLQNLMRPSDAISLGQQNRTQPNGSLSSLLGQFGMNQNQLFGQDADYLSQTFRDRAGAGLGNTLTEALNLGRGNIERGVGTAFDRIGQETAGSGVSGANFYTNALRAGGDANAQLTSNIAQLGEQQNERALANLNQLNQSQAGLGQNLFGNLLQNKQFVNQMLQQNDQFLANLGLERAKLEEAKRQFDESNSFDIGELFGSVLGGASNVATGFGLNEIFNG